LKEIAVVILNWNGEKLLQEFLPKILLYSDKATIYVADNASTDNSISILKRDFPSVHIIENTANFGFAKGYNEALRTIKEPILALVNSDIEVTENWLNPILALLKKEPNTAIVQPKILDYKKRDFFEYAGAAGGYIDKYGFPFCRGRLFDTLEQDNQQYNDITNIFWSSGACFFIRNEVFQSLNGFDEDFFAHQEEIDLCWRAFNQGYEAKYCSDSTVYHIGGATLQTGSPKKTFLNFRNSLWMLTKNVPSNQLFFTLFIRLIFDGIAGVRFLIQGKPKHFWAVLKSHFYFYWFLPKFLKKRTRTKNSNYYKIKSVVTRYFINKQHRFSDLF
jgi:GT2 family glycosyltransferase